MEGSERAQDEAQDVHVDKNMNKVTTTNFVTSVDVIACTTRSG